MTGSDSQISKSVMCPNCDVPMMLLTSRVYRHRNGRPRKMFQCPTCDCRHGCHPDGTAVGTPADRETREARIKLHALIDPLWKERQMSRNAVYRMMRQVFGKDIHVGGLSKQECGEVYETMRAHMEKLGYETAAENVHAD